MDKEEYIKKSDAVHVILKQLVPVSGDPYSVSASDSINVGLSAAVTAVRQLPCADVDVVIHGRWRNGLCTRCRNDVWFNGHGLWGFKYCPNCGAKMDGKEGGKNSA